MVILSFFLDVIDGDLAACKVTTKETYQNIDKGFDYWVYIFEMAYAWIHFPTFRILLLVLFAWRTVGTIIFYFHQKREMFLLFGNYFENVFFVIFFGKMIPGLKFILADKVVYYWTLAAVTAEKIFQEWFIHIAKLSVMENVLGGKKHWLPS